MGKSEEGRGSELEIRDMDLRSEKDEMGACIQCKVDKIEGGGKDVLLVGAGSCAGEALLLSVGRCGLVLDVVLVE